MTTTLPRITARVDSDTQQLLQQAAAITGISSINAFVVNAAIEKAKAIVAQELTLKLSQRDAILLMEALDAPIKPNARLQQAAKDYESKMQK